MCSSRLRVYHIIESLHILCFFRGRQLESHILCGMFVHMYNWRAGVSQPSGPNGTIFLDIYVRTSGYCECAELRPYFYPKGFQNFFTLSLASERTRVHSTAFPVLFDA